MNQGPTCFRLADCSNDANNREDTGLEHPGWIQCIVAAKFIAVQREKLSQIYLFPIMLSVLYVSSLGFNLVTFVLLLF